MKTMTLTELLALAHSRPLIDAELAELNRLSGGFSDHLGLRITHASAERVRGHLEVGDCHLQPFGLVNGGVYASIGETLGSVAGACAAAAPVVGINNSTHFVASTGSGVIHAEALPIHCGRSTQTWEISMSQEGKLLAKMTLQTMVLRA